MEIGAKLQIKPKALPTCEVKQVLFWAALIIVP
jgi:hypothetical protein